ncbi:hypothetical protein NBRC10512_004830 [Rhodotorula toruloides]|uniref:RHTO0S03e01860g1_1 n=2 Tax=Rhodotorula toruloides TaxID=5286 RepID=A0A061AKC5_RHOTO|nr:uncharacterized protein RHTO_00117 [Rhodotorula toruloides NP11]EMS25689.1 hypothetical protein RHTO_00117 [Rhodotorula toruloides NP11]KAJ8296099.1 hypothetical protein OF846_001415 [Rhodotorula toruloides]CDR38009.1 RHTO0S03e01860g1_1 [Rhodotorula toruloides]
MADPAIAGAQMAQLATSSATPGAAAPPIPPVASDASGGAPLASSSSSGISPSPAAPPTPSAVAGAPSAATPATAKGKGKAKAAGQKNKAAEGPDGEPKPKKKKTAAKKPGEPGPGKSWRKGLKGNLAGVGLDPAVAAGLHGAGTPGASSPGGAGSPAPSRASAAGGTGGVGAPPKLGNQFLATQPLQIGTPRPRKWIKGKMEFKRYDGATILLPSWQGDSYSAFATAVGTAEIDELASPPPASSPLPPLPSSKPRAAPSPAPRASAPAQTHVPPAQPPMLFPPTLPALPPQPARPQQAPTPAPTAGVKVEDAPTGQTQMVSAHQAGLGVDASAAPAFTPATGGSA